MRIVEGRKAGALLRRTVDREVKNTAAFEAKVRRMVSEVRRKGDRALRRYAQRWDGLQPGMPLRVAAAEMDGAWKSAPAELKKALQEAAANIRKFCEWQGPTEWRREMRPGVVVGQLVRPLESVGCYVPAGRYPLPSTLLMTVIPAQVAGVTNIRVVSPRPSPAILAAAGFLGVKEFYRVGGAQAIAALAYGTESMPMVDKIVGPGNRYVVSAKKLVAFDCAIDFVAGPTEVMISSEDGNPVYIAADLVAQAEHDPDAVAVFITASRSLARAVSAQVRKVVRNNAVAERALERNGLIVIASSREEALHLANQFAPEHLTVGRDDVARVNNAGSVFVGDYSPQAVGDYASGPNHVLPTGGAARFRGGLSVLDFVKLISIQELSLAGLREIAPTVQRLAEAEGLRAHAESVRVRCASA